MKDFKILSSGCDKNSCRIIIYKTEMFNAEYRFNFYTTCSSLIFFYKPTSFLFTLFIFNFRCSYAFAVRFYSFIL